MRCRLCRVLSQGAPGKAERSLLFLVTTIRELGLALAGTRGDPCLEASVLEAAFQVPLPFLLSAARRVYSAGSFAFSSLYGSTY